jgi:hypothetical protein
LPDRRKRWAATAYAKQALCACASEGDWKIAIPATFYRHISIS